MPKASSNTIAWRPRSSRTGRSRFWEPGVDHAISVCEPPAIRTWGFAALCFGLNMPVTSSLRRTATLHHTNKPRLVRSTAEPDGRVLHPDRRSTAPDPPPPGGTCDGSGGVFGCGWRYWTIESTTLAVSALPPPRGVTVNFTGNPKTGGPAGSPYGESASVCAPDLLFERDLGWPR